MTAGETFKFLFEESEPGGESGLASWRESRENVPALHPRIPVGDLVTPAVGNTRGAQSLKHTTEEALLLLLFVTGMQTVTRVPK